MRSWNMDHRSRGAPTLAVVSVNELSVVDFPLDGLPTSPMSGSRGMVLHGCRSARWLQALREVIEPRCSATCVVVLQQQTDSEDSLRLKWGVQEQQSFCRGGQPPVSPARRANGAGRAVMAAAGVQDGAPDSCSWPCGPSRASRTSSPSRWAAAHQSPVA